MLLVQLKQFEEFCEKVSIFFCQPFQKVKLVLYMVLLSELFQAFISSNFDNDGLQLIKPEGMQSFPEPLIGLAVWLHNHKDC